MVVVVVVVQTLYRWNLIVLSTDFLYQFLEAQAAPVGSLCQYGMRALIA